MLLSLVLSVGFEPANRIEYLEEVLEAIATSDAHKLADTERYVDVTDRNECRSVYHRLRAQCLIESARRLCRGKRKKDLRQACLFYSDVIVTNKLSESEFVTTQERYTIMRQSRDFRRRLRQELRHRYASLATELSLSRDFNCGYGETECLARSIDAYCVEYADTHSLSWQHCAAAVTWIIGMARFD